MTSRLQMILFALIAWVAAKDKVIDVSHWNGQIDWGKVKAAGVTLAVAKATEGITYTDDTFSTNWKGMKQNGIQAGAYHYLRGADAPKSQVKNIKNALQSVNFGAKDMLVIDVEAGNNQNVGKIKMARNVKKVLEGLKSDYNNLWIYTGPYYWEDNVAWKTYDFSQYKLWIADYTTESQPVVPTTWKAKGYSLWQFTDEGKVNGVSGDVDMSRF